MAARHPLKRRTRTKSRAAFDWRVCVQALSQKHLERFRDWRGLSGEFCSWLHQRALIGLYDACIALPIHENGAVVAAHYRLKDGSWRVHPREVGMRPLVIGDIGSCNEVHAFESQWDAFAACDKLAIHETDGWRSL